MKIGKLKLAYFKRFRELELDFYDEAGQPRNLVVLVGDNGAGKTTVLQAIALTLGTATNRFKEPEELDWPGFEAELAHEGWRIPPNIPSVECEVVFDRDELAAIQECFERTRMFGDPKFIPPGNEQTTTLCYFANGKVDARTPPAFFQFRGRDYAKQVLSQHPEGRDVFKRLGGVFWYTQHRTATSLTPWQSENSMLSTDLLRQRLSEWQNIHLQVTQKTHSLKPHQRDLYAELARHIRDSFQTAVLWERHRGNLKMSLRLHGSC